MTVEATALVCRHCFGKLWSVLVNDRPVAIVCRTCDGPTR